MAWLRDNPDSPSLISLKQSITFPPDRKAKTSPIRNWTPSDKNHRNLDCGDLWARSHTHTHHSYIYTSSQEWTLRNWCSNCLWKKWGTGENWEFVGGGRLIFFIIVFSPPNFMYLFLAALVVSGGCVVSGGYSPAAVSRLPIVVASLIVEHGFQGTGSIAMVHRLNCCMACGIFLNQGLVQNLCLLH